MKKVSLIILSIVLLVSVVSVGVSAFAYDGINQTNDVYVVKEIELDNGQKINKLSDGRVSPVKNANELQKDDLDNILNEMNFSEEDLVSLDLNTKKEIVSNGGAKVETTTNYAEHSFLYEGEEYTVEGSNMEEVKIEEDMIKQKDKNGKKDKNTVNIQSTLIGNSNYDKVDGIWQGRMYVLYMGIYGSQYRYDVYFDFDWDGAPICKFKDVYGLSWSFKGERDANLTYANVSRIGTPTETPSNYHTVWSYWHSNIPSTQYPINGVGKESIFIPNTLENNGSKYNIYGMYTHNLTPVPGSITTLLVSWDVSDLTTDNWVWGETFTIKPY